MPADEEELVMAVEDGVEFAELLAPVKLENGVLYCKRMVLGDIDASGRRGVVETDQVVEVPADTVIAAVGEKVPGAILRELRHCSGQQKTSPGEPGDTGDFCEGCLCCRRRPVRSRHGSGRNQGRQDGSRSHHRKALAEDLLSSRTQKHL